MIHVHIHFTTRSMNIMLQWECFALKFTIFPSEVVALGTVNALAWSFPGSTSSRNVGELSYVPCILLSNHSSVHIKIWRMWTYRDCVNHDRDKAEEGKHDNKSREGHTWNTVEVPLNGWFYTNHAHVNLCVIHSMLLGVWRRRVVPGDILPHWI